MRRGFMSDEEWAAAEEQLGRDGSSTDSEIREFLSVLDTTPRLESRVELLSSYLAADEHGSVGGGGGGAGPSGGA
jgi:hypothetical protein